MQIEVLKQVNSARQARQAVVIVTDLAAGSTAVFTEGQPVPDGLRDVVGKALQTGKSGLAEADGAQVFLNVYLPPPRIVAIGAVHITQALARLAPMMNFDLSIIDPRTAFATPERFEGVDLIADWPEDVLKDRGLDAYTALVAVTHDPKIDDYPIADALRSRCFYVGALGGRKTHAKRIERLKEVGLSDEDISSIRAPIGLDIGASSPEEIALAIMAEIVQAFRRRPISGQSA
ncbi:XdhC/CoxF family protein [Rhizobium sp. Root149]|uniref:XdhC family protein n=1 Tax=Rhizobium sp. Root149 TaxID=1736473 RepID=UPI0007147756|nr:XdhC family protein [Rhizobium sp. Root149]KQZ54888.1 XdhC/CoxF family protein [Rhizobium sp. Root149]